MPDDVESIVALGKQIEGVLKAVEVGRTGNVKSIRDAPVAVVLEPLDVMLVVVVKTEPVYSSLSEIMGVVVADNGILSASINGTEVTVVVEVDAIVVLETSVLLTIVDEVVVVPTVRLSDDGALPVLLASIATVASMIAT